MKKILVLSCLFLLPAVNIYPVLALEGFYKDVFVDEGTDLGGPSRMPALEFLSYTSEWMDIEDNYALQTSIMTQNFDDDNGVLVYPDGEPRFAIVYFHGGSMGHFGDLGDEGVRIVRSHYYNGGSQFGSCAGSYLLSRRYFAYWPGRMDGPNTSGDRVEHTIPDDSPLHNYADFGPDNIVTNIVHNNGGSVDIENAPDGTVILAIHRTVPLNPDMEGYGAIWSWKDNDTTGRVVGITSHPEGSRSEDQRNEMAAIILYLTDDIAPPPVKHQLTNGTTITMDKTTADNDPIYTKIGDRQYHHFTIDLPDGARNLAIALDAEDGYDMHLFARNGTFAFIDSAEYADTSTGPDKTLSIATVAAGAWYIGVKCATTVEATDTDTAGDSYYKYSGNLSVLNGVAYSVQATWEPAGIIAQKTPHTIDNQLAINFIGRDVTFRTGKVLPQSLKIYDTQGRLCWNARLSQGTKKYAWQPGRSGMYIISMRSGNEVFTKRINIVK